MKAQRFSWKLVVAGAFLLAAAYLPTLGTPFDFIDDGDLVYPAPPGTSLSGFVTLWWQKVVNNVEHLGPFRPVLWVHWVAQQNLLGADPFLWRLSRLGTIAVASGLMLAFLRDAGFRAPVAFAVTAAAMWNPYRNEIWTSLTLAEGTAMPCSFLAFLAARRAANSPKRSGCYDLVALLAFFGALGCKNVFVVLLPALLILRMKSETESWREGLRRTCWRLLIYFLPLVLPLGHFVYFQTHWKPGHYETQAPSLAQAHRILLWQKGAIGADFLGAGYLAMLVVLVVQWRSSGRRLRSVLARYQQVLVVGILLFLAGCVIYLPFRMMAMRYTMPAVWGWDFLFAATLTAISVARVRWQRRVAWGLVLLGLGLVSFVNVDRQIKFAARAQLLTQAMEFMKQNAPQNAVILWSSGDRLNAEEGIHFRWHLIGNGRPDIGMILIDESGKRLKRPEVPEASSVPTYRMTAELNDLDPRWKEERRFSVPYRFGRKKFEVRLDRLRTTEEGAIIDPQSFEAMWKSLSGE